ncbi:GSCOCG00000583001-RA-CDS [Cotesia congregata]|nr:GSCOCG00000583001-RA-CDS [Cotesia congregata]
MATPTNGNGNLIDEFEDSLQQCMNILTKEEGLTNNSIGSSLAVDKEEAKAEVEQVVSRFIDLARQTEAFFLQKRFLLSALKPELLVKEDISELRQELARKDELIKRHYDKIATWQHLLADLQGWDKSLAQGSAPNGKQWSSKPSTPAAAAAAATTTTATATATTNVASATITATTAAPHAAAPNAATTTTSSTTGI